ncbi:MAG: condensation domain-containing protein, partial [Blastocatellia bacterium]
MRQGIEQLKRLSAAEKRALLREMVKRAEEPDSRSTGPKISLASFAQQRLWFLDRLMGGSEFYNVSNALRVNGSLDVNAIERSMNEIVCRHEVLRTSFAMIDGKPVQVIVPSLTLKLPVVDLTGIAELPRESLVRRLAIEQIRRPFDLS